jgi:hypothetical protein
VEFQNSSAAIIALKLSQEIATASREGNTMEKERF